MSAELSIPQLGRVLPLARGGTATVHLVPDLTTVAGQAGPFVYKKYNDRTKQAAGQSLGRGLANFVQFREVLPVNQRTAWDERIIWPVAVVKDASGAADGIIMRIIPDRFFQDYVKRAGGTRRKPREIETLFGDTETAVRTGLPDVTLTTRLQLLRAIAGAYAMMHKEGVVLGDISGRNILYDPDPKHPAIMVVDVDSARIRGNRSTFGSQPHTPNWQPPEAMSASRALEQGARSGIARDARERLQNTWSIQSVKTDAYKFGLLVVRVLDHGRGCAVNRDARKARKVLGDRVSAQAQQLLDASMSDKPNERPTMKDWYQAFQGSSSPSAPKQKQATTVSTPPVQRPEPGLVTGTRRGNWEWVEGTGWSRVPR